MTKVYGVSGYTTLVVKIPFNGGGGLLECEFDRGIIGRGPSDRPATYATADPAKQGIIEGSEYYGKLIYLVRKIGQETPARTDAPVASTAAQGGGSPAATEAREYPDVTTREEAVAFLKANGAKATNLKDDDAIKAYCAKAGISFPNLAL